MGKELNRRSFLVGCGLLTFSSAGVFLTGCGGDNDNDNDNDDDDHKGKGKDNDNDDYKGKKNDGKKVPVEATNRELTITANQFKTLTEKNSVDVPESGLVVFSYNKKYYGFSNVCPHDGGTLKVEDGVGIRCQKHTSQTFDKDGITNKSRTRANIKLITLNVKSA